MKLFSIVHFVCLVICPPGIAESVWDPFSATQTNRLAAVMQKLINGYPTVVNSGNKNTEV